MGGVNKWKWVVFFSKIWSYTPPPPPPPTIRFGRVPVSRYFNHRLLNYTHPYSSNADYIFCAQSVPQQIQISNFKIKSPQQREKYQECKCSMFRNYKEFVDNLVWNEQGFLFMGKTRGTMPYWIRLQVLTVFK